MPTKLEEIVLSTRQHLAKVTETRVHEWEKRARLHQPRGFKKSLARHAHEGTAVIAELKKASPSKGLLREHFDPVNLAKELEAAGAAALSVLTNEPYFQGSIENLERASAAVKIPCLRKDIILSTSQIVEARAYGADAILLIVAALSDTELRELNKFAHQWGLDVLCEVHERDELKRAVNLGFDLIGVNNRDLHSLHVDMENSLRFVGDFPPHIFQVAESGIDGPATISRLKAVGYKAFLVGERLMRSDSPGDTLRELLA